jgi:hypothetical protein
VGVLGGSWELMMSKMALVLTVFFSLIWLFSLKVAGLRALADESD